MTDNSTPSSREEILRLLKRERASRVPCFSGLTSVTEPGLASLGLCFSEIHTDAAKMAAAAATTFELFGFESVNVPTDMCVEAAALGAQVDFREDVSHPMFPLIAAPLASTPQEFYFEAKDIAQHARVAVVVHAIHLLKARVGQHVAIGAWVPGPLTLAMQVIDLNNLLVEVAREPRAVSRVLDALGEALAQVALAYRAAGADFITVHEMGGSPGVIGPTAFQQIVLPPLQRLMSALGEMPRVLSVCGNTNRAMGLLAEAGADAISVDQMNDLAHSRQVLGANALLFGNIDPVGTLANGDEAAVRRAVAKALQAGVDAIWPGCDLWPMIPAANMRALVEETKRPSNSSQK